MVPLGRTDLRLRISRSESGTGGWKNAGENAIEGNGMETKRELMQRQSVEEKWMKERSR